MPNVLVLYEIAYRASQVKTKKAYKEFERWVKNTIQATHDAAVEHAARIQLFRLQEQFSF